MIPGFDKASDTGKENDKGKGIGLGEVPPGIDNLPDKIKAKFGYSTDSNLDSQSTDGTGNEINSAENGETEGFFESLFGFGAASDNANPDAQGIGLGKIPWIFDSGFLPDDNAYAPPFLEFGDDVAGNFEPGKYGKAVAEAAKLKAAQIRAEHESGSKKPDNAGPPEDPPGPPDDPPGGGGPPPGKGKPP